MTKLNHSNSWGLSSQKIVVEVGLKLEVECSNYDICTFKVESNFGRLRNNH